MIKKVLQIKKLIFLVPSSWLIADLAEGLRILTLKLLASELQFISLQTNGWPEIFYIKIYKICFSLILIFFVKLSCYLLELTFSCNLYNVLILWHLRVFLFAFFFLNFSP